MRCASRSSLAKPRASLSGVQNLGGSSSRPPARPRPKGQQDLARVRAPFSTPVHGHGARILPSNGTLPGGAPAGWAVRGAHRAWPGAGGQRRPLSQLPQRSDRQRRIYSAGLPFKSCIESNSRPAYSVCTSVLGLATMLALVHEKNT